MRLRLFVAVMAALVLLAGGCNDGGDGSLRIYTSVTQATVDAVIDGFAVDHPDVPIEVFRAPTGELTARIAAEQREGGLTADVLWLTDPLSMQQYDGQGLLRLWTPRGAAELPEAYRTDTFWGTRILTMVMVAGDEVTAPVSWADLANPRYEGRVAFPDPGFAGSAFAVLGYFAETEAYGVEFFRALADNGAVQVNAPGEVVTGVAEGRFDAGITLDFSARNAAAKGSPIKIIWPEDGAISLYSPIAVVSGADDRGSAEALVEYVLGRDGQERIAATGWQPIWDAVAWTTGGAQVTVDWSRLFDRQQELLGAYRAIFGG